MKYRYSTHNDELLDTSVHDFLSTIHTRHLSGELSFPNQIKYLWKVYGHSHLWSINESILNLNHLMMSYLCLFSGIPQQLSVFVDNDKPS